MAIDLKFDLAENPEPPAILLSNRNGNILGQLDIDVESIDMSDKFNDASEFSFTLYKYVDDKLTNLWDKVVDFKLVYCQEWDEWFEIKVELDESTETIKTVFCTQLEKSELSQLNLYGLEINTEKDIERDDYKICILYDENDADASILNRCLRDKAPHYSIVHVDSTIAKIQRSFSFDKVSIDDAFQEIAEEIGCVFIYHSYLDENRILRRTVSVYDLQQNCNDCGYRGEFIDECPKCNSTNIQNGYGEDTLIFITADELATSGIELTTDTDSVKNCFKLEAGDDLMSATVRNCNPNGTDYIWYFSNNMKEDMSEELVDKLKSYDELCKYHYSDSEYSVDADLLNGFNNLVDKYSDYNENLQKIETPLKGHSSLMNAYYNTIDLALYLKSGLMPSVKMSKTTAEKQVKLLTSSSLSPVAVADVTIVSLSTANSAVLAMAKVIIKSTYKVEIKTSELYDDINAKYWKGKFIITNYSDEEDVAESDEVSVKLNDDLETVTKQKLEKALNKENTDDLSISGLFEKSYDDFCVELKKYALNPLTSFYDACQVCIDIMTEQGVGNEDSWSDNEENSEGNLYEKLYMPYYNKLVAIESEMKVRENEINIICGTYDIDNNLVSKGLQNDIEECRNEIQNILNFKNYLGERLWLEFCAYRREDTYSNDNYISDGLNNAELFKRALEFYDVAENEIYKSSELQNSISTTLNNLLAIPKFKPFVEHFKVGNWIRVQVDNKIYKLRLIKYDISFKDFDNISVDFSDITKIKNGITDTQSVFKQASSMSTTYSSVKRQASQGNSAKDVIKQWTSEGLNTSDVQIHDDYENIIITKSGLLGRLYDDIEKCYSPKQVKITYNTLAYTDNNWESVRLAIGEYNYKFYDNSDGIKDFVDKVGYGINADAVTAGVVIGSQIIGGDIYSDNYSVVNGTGSYLNLRDGTFSFGGGALRFENNKLLISSPDVPTTETITQINEEYLKTTSVYAQNLQVGAAHIQGELTASQINTKGLIAENISGTTITGKNIVGGSLLIGDKTDTYAEITESGFLNCNGGKIGGWDISKSTLKAGNAILNSNGDITGSGWSIANNGKASFSDIYVTGGSISLGGTVINSNTASLKAENTKVNDVDFNEYIEELVIGTLSAEKINSCFTTSQFLEAPIIHSDMITCNTALFINLLNQYGDKETFQLDKWIRVESTDGSTYLVPATNGESINILADE